LKFYISIREKSFGSDREKMCVQIEKYLTMDRQDIAEKGRIRKSLFKTENPFCNVGSGRTSETTLHGRQEALPIYNVASKFHRNLFL
jgi:hypothetical protein